MATTNPNQYNLLGFAGGGGDMGEGSIMRTLPAPVPPATTDQQTQQQPMPLRIDTFNAFIAGGIALSSSFAVMHPLDTLKTRIQAAAVKGNGKSALLGLGGKEMWMVLRRGFVASVVGAGPQGGLRWATYEVCKHHLTPAHPANKPHNPHLPNAAFLATSAISAIAGDFVSSIVKVPREVVTARLQTAGITSGQKATGTQIFKHILQTEGPSGLFRGFWSTTARDWPFMALLFTMYDSLKVVHHHFALPTNASPKPSSQATTHYTYTIPMFHSTFYGGLAGFVAAFLTTPADVVRTRIMTGGTTDRSMRSVVREMWKQGGAKVFFAGSGARSVWWFGVCSIFFPVYEFVKRGMDGLMAPS
ncbi:mitochondrial carrier domain-containing protein [Phlyctochytrium arcticum]|nr:mitochondrial carrier domain-containing protein [Phlyctochytrium arcticum]